MKTLLVVVGLIVILSQLAYAEGIKCFEVYYPGVGTVIKCYPI